MRLFFILLVPFITSAMNNSTAEQLEHQKKVALAYKAIRNTVTKEYQDFTDALKEAEALEQAHAHSLTSAFYHELHLCVIMPLVGSTQEYYELAGGLIKRQYENKTYKDALPGIMLDTAFLGVIKAQRMVAEQLSERIRKKAGL